MPLSRREVIAAAAMSIASSGWAQNGRNDIPASKLPRVPNVVLVHGAFADGSSWTEVITRLQSAGFAVTAVQNPLTSLSDDVAATKRVLERQDGPVVLVGHSWGGAVITQAGDAANVSALVYVSALAPDAGESMQDLQQHGAPAEGMQNVRPDKSGLLWVDASSYAHALAADLPPARVRVLTAVQQPIAASAFAEKVTAAAWRRKPSWFILSEADQALSPDLQRWMAERMHAQVTAVPSSHMSLISHADVVARVVEKAASQKGN